MGWLNSLWYTHTVGHCIDLKKQGKFYSAHIHTHSQDYTCISIPEKAHRKLRDGISPEGTWLLGNWGVRKPVFHEIAL